MAINGTHDSSRELRHMRLIFLSTLFVIGATGCVLVFIWLVRFAKWNVRSARICSMILNLIIADLSVCLFATGTQIYWEYQTNWQWPFNDMLCRVIKFFQSFSILSSTYIIVVMTIDRCIAILAPLKVVQIRVLYLCGSAWILAGLLSVPNIFIFNLYTNGSFRYCTSIFSRQSSTLGRRIYLTFISFVVYFIPFIIIVLSYTCIFIKLLYREKKHHDQTTREKSPNPDVYCNDDTRKKQQLIDHRCHFRSSYNHFSSFRKPMNIYAKARSKTFRMIIVLVLFMILFGAPYYCLELYVAYTGQTPSDVVLAVAGGAAVAPSSFDPWIFLLFWVNWHESPHDRRNRRLMYLSVRLPIQYNHSGRVNRSNILATSINGACPQNQPLCIKSSLLKPVGSVKTSAF